MEEPMIKWGAAIFISYYVIKELFKLLYKRSDYVMKDDCRSFRTRIGKESDEHREHIAEVKDCLSDIKADLGFIKGKVSRNGMDNR